MAEELSWDKDSAAYIRARGKRYPEGMDIDPEWAREVMAATATWINAWPATGMDLKRNVKSSSSASNTGKTHTETDDPSRRDPRPCRVE